MRNVSQRPPTIFDSMAPTHRWDLATHMSSRPYAERTMPLTDLHNFSPILTYTDIIAESENIWDLLLPAEIDYVRDAHAIHQDVGKTSMRWTLEALACAKLPADKISDMLYIPLPIVQVYLLAFFDVEKHLDSPLTFEHYVLNRGKRAVDKEDKQAKIIARQYGLDTYLVFYKQIHMADISEINTRELAKEIYAFTLDKSLAGVSELLPSQIDADTNLMRHKSLELSEASTQARKGGDGLGVGVSSDAHAYTTGLWDAAEALTLKAAQNNAGKKSRALMASQSMSAEDLVFAGMHAETQRQLKQEEMKKLRNLKE